MSLSKPLRHPDFSAIVSFGRYVFDGGHLIQLYGFTPVWGLPDCSPFVTKVDAYLRLASVAAA